MAALLNSEFAKCSAGSGDFVWGSGGSSCASDAVATQIVTHFETIGLMNPYARTSPQVSVEKSDGAEWNGTDGDQVAVLGQTAVHCNAAGCTIATKQGTGADTHLAVAAY